MSPFAQLQSLPSCFSVAMAESDCSEKDHSYESQILTNMCSWLESSQSGSALMSSSITRTFPEQFASKFSFPTLSDADPGTSDKEDSRLPVTESLSSLKSMALTRTLDFEKLFSVVEKVLFDPSKVDEIKNEHEAGLSESNEEVQSARFRSKFTHNLTLYQDYCLQDIQRFRESSLSELVTPCIKGLQTHLGELYLSQPSSPQISPSPAPVCLTPPPSTIQVSPSSLWQDLQEVKASDLLQDLSPKEIRLHETAFELICSEASYLRSLEIAVQHFYASKALRRTLTQMEHHFLFSNIQRVMAASEKFLTDMELRLGECLLIGSQIGDIVLRHCPAFRRLYVPYVTNMMYQETLIRQLLQQNKDFQSVLTKLEKSPVCQRQNLKSFLVLPFQRITRIKLLLETVLRLSKPESNAFTNLEKAILTVHEVLQECDNGVRKMKQIEELVCLETQLDFGKVKSVPLVISGRALMHQGAVKQLSLESSVQPRTFFTDIHLHLLSDMLIISSQRDGKFEVLDLAQFPSHTRCEGFKAEVLGLPQNSFLLHLSKRETGPATVLVLVTDTRFAKETWMKVLSAQM